MTVRETITAIYQAYGERDLDKTLSFVADDFCWVIAIDPGSAPYGGECTGKAAMLDRMKILAETFEYMEVDLKDLLTDGDGAAARLVMRLKCKAGGDPFDLNCCHFWRVVDGKCTSLTEVYDTGIMSKNMCQLRAGVHSFGMSVAQTLQLIPSFRTRKLNVGESYVRRRCVNPHF